MILEISSDTAEGNEKVDELARNRSNMEKTPGIKEINAPISIYFEEEHRTFF